MQLSSLPAVSNVYSYIDSVKIDNDKQVRAELRLGFGWAIGTRVKDSYKIGVQALEWFIWIQNLDPKATDVSRQQELRMWFLTLASN